MRKTALLLFGALIIGMMIFSACAPASELPAEATKIAQTVVAGAATVQSAGQTIQTILTPIASPTATQPVDLTTVCIPPIGWEALTDISLPNNLRVSALGQWVTLSDNDYKAKSIVQATEKKSTPFAELGVNVEVVYACGAVYINPDSK